MCTLTWFHTERGYELAFNRDEQRARGPEVPAAAATSEGVRFAAPRDADFGGTWIAVNELGVAVALLNAYELTSPDPPGPDARSRGLLVASLVAAASAQDALDRAEAQDLPRFRPFVLAVFEPGEDARVARWDGRRLAPLADAEAPLVSSGVALDEVRAHRRAVFAEMERRTGVVDRALLDAFHASHAGGPSELSPCMHRADAETRSSCRVVVGPDEVALIHTPGAPCTTRPLPPVALARRGARAASLG